jgi:hypothetical protein
VLGIYGGKVLMKCLVPDVLQFGEPEYLAVYLEER